MRVKEISFERRFSLPNYEFETYKVVAEVDEGEDDLKVMRHIKGQLEKMKGGQTNGEEKVSKKSDTKEDNKKENSKKVKSKNTPYDRNSELHKKLYVEFLNDEFPGWNKKDSPMYEAAKRISRESEGKEFLTPEGFVSLSFKAPIRKELEMLRKSKR